MALASYSSRTPKPQPSRTKRSVSRRYPDKISPKSSKADVYPFPTSKAQSLSPKLSFLLTLQKRFSLLTFVLVLATLTTYAWTVYAPKLWSREYRKLEALQRHERHLTTTNETLKNQLADQAEKPNSGFSKANPSHNIFLPAKPISPPSPATDKPLSDPSPIITHPVAY